MDDLLNHLAAAGRPQEQAILRPLFTEDTLRQYGALGEAMPDHAVAPGDSWPLVMDVPSTIGVLTMNMKYTFKNWEQRGNRRCAHIEMAGAISSKSVSTGSGVAVEIKGGKILGSLWFEPAAGMIAEVDNDQNIPLFISAPGGTLTSQLSRTLRLTRVDVP